MSSRISSIFCTPPVFSRFQPSSRRITCWFILEASDAPCARHAHEWESVSATCDRRRAEAGVHKPASCGWSAGHAASVSPPAACKLMLLAPGYGTAGMQRLSLLPPRCALQAAGGQARRPSRQKSAIIPSEGRRRSRFEKGVKSGAIAESLMSRSANFRNMSRWVATTALANFFSRLHGTNRVGSRGGPHDGRQRHRRR